MIQVEFSNERLDGGLLYSVLTRHQLLPACLNDPNICLLAAQEMCIGFLHDGKENPLAVMIESYPEPGVVGLMFITEIARLNKRRNELIEASTLLRDRWFNQMGAFRVEARIPIERTQTMKCLIHLGFRLETLPKGLRNAVIMNGVPRSLCILGLLPTDPIHELSNTVKEPIMNEESV